MAGKGILLDDDFDLIVSSGSLVIGDSEMQETAIILGMNEGELKNLPELGPNLIQLVKANASRVDIEQRSRIHLGRDGKDYNALKNKIETTIR